MTTAENVNDHEIQKFGALADRWWDDRGEFKTLHAVNPLRLQFIRTHAELKDQRVIDVGCGGGILSEGLARAGAKVTGIDPVPTFWKLPARMQKRGDSRLTI